MPQFDGLCYCGLMDRPESVVLIEFTLKAHAHRPLSRARDQFRYGLTLASVRRNSLNDSADNFMLRFTSGGHLFTANFNDEILVKNPLIGHILRLDK